MENWKKLLGLCEHKWEASGFSYIRCKKCNAGRYNPSLAAELNNQWCQKMVDAGVWDKQDTNDALEKESLKKVA